VYSRVPLPILYRVFENVSTLISIILIIFPDIKKGPPPVGGPWNRRAMG
jgi:hypothetical protein